MVDRIFQRIGNKMIHEFRITPEGNAYLTLTNKSTNEKIEMNMDHIDPDMVETIPEQLIMSGYTEVKLILPD